MGESPASILREALHRSGLTNRALAQRTSVTEGRISDYLSERHDPSASRLIELLAATGFRIRIDATRDGNGAILAELLELADAVTPAGVRQDRDAPRRFADLIAPRG